MNLKSIIPLLLVGLGSTAQDIDIFVAGKNWQGECNYQIENTSASTARVFYYKSDYQIDSKNIQLDKGEANLMITPNTALVLLYLKEGSTDKHIWVSIENDSLKVQANKHLFLGNAYAGQYSDLTGIDTDFEKALNFYDTYKSETSVIDPKLFSERYWSVKRTVDSSNVLHELKERMALVNNADEYEFLIRNLSALGEYEKSEQLKSQFVKNFPNHPEAIEMATWDLRKESYITKDNNERFQLYKKYIDQVSHYKGVKSLERIDAHKAQFLIRLYDFYLKKGHDWHKEVATFSPSNQVYVYAITASNMIQNNPFEAMALIEKALEVKDESLIKEFSKNSIFLPEEQKRMALKCKELPYFLKGKIHLKSKLYDLAAESLEKAVSLNEYSFPDYYEAYLDALIALNDKDNFMSTMSLVEAKSKLSEKYQKAKEEFLNQEKEALAVAMNPVLEKLPLATFDTKEGAKLSTDRFKNKTIVIDFWSNSCDKCVQSFPGMYYLQKVYAKPDVEFYLVNVDAWQFDDADFRAANFNLQERGYAEFTQLFDFNGSARKAFKVESLPSKIIIDPNGDIKYFQDNYMGVNEVEELEKVLKKIIKDQGKTSK
ncbi:Thiol-disulfide isomerase or thioredoxin [Spirosomataceae bacterium TFI 002]|nr:Thiol-disulfide isomerase or thioredoxin [Spirosomataceae bacterium TFI 002]